MQHNSLIIGAGIAGASVAHCLAMRGHKVMVLEREAAPAMGASGNPMAVLFPQLTKQWTPLSRFSFMAYAHMQREMVRWQQEGEQVPVLQSGMIQLPRNDSDLLKFETLHEKLSLSHEVVRPMGQGEVREVMPSYAAHQNGLFFPHGAAINIAKACQNYLSHPNITVQFNASIEALNQISNGWCVSLKHESFEAEKLVLCNATDLLIFEQTAHYPIFWNRGQLTYLPAHAVTHGLEKIICHKGYIVPLSDGGYLIGATYDREFHGLALRMEDHEENLAAVRAQFPGWVKDEVRAEMLEGRASNRSVSKDRAPLIGPAVDAHGSLINGLYISAAHGSRGMLSAPLGAEYLANLITQAPFSGLPSDVERALSPERFVK